VCKFPLEAWTWTLGYDRYLTQPFPRAVHRAETELVPIYNQLRAVQRTQSSGTTVAVELSMLTWNRHDTA
jgi:hypothetical protein